MKVLVKHFKKAPNGIDTVFENGVPVSEEHLLVLPITFAYGSYNEPKKLINCGIDVCDVQSISDGMQAITTADGLIVDALFIKSLSDNRILYLSQGRLAICDAMTKTIIRSLDIQMFLIG